MEGKVVVQLSTCLFASDFSPTIREWTHFCFLFSNTIEMIANESLFLFNCNATEFFDAFKTDIIIRIGKSQENDLPFSGKLADIRIYLRKINQEEVQIISKLSNEPLPDETIPLREYSNSNQENELSSTIDVDIMSINKEELLAPYSPNILLHFIHTGNFYTANLLCKKFKGSLPDKDASEIEKVAILFDDYMEHSSYSLHRFWMSSNNNNNETNCTTGMFTSSSSPSIDIKFESCDNSIIDQLCIVEKKNSYSLIGHKGNPIKFFPIPYERLVFESLENLQLYIQNGRIMLKDLSKNKILRYAKVSKNSLLGRYKWYKQSDDKLAKEITLTGCDETQFTCSDGQCIKLYEVCDYHPDCPDRSDELRYCEAGLNPPEFYDINLPPTSVTKKPTKLDLYFYIFRISKIDMNDNTIGITVDISISWVDPRLNFKFLKINHTLPVSNEFSSLYWQPDIDIKGAIRDDEGKLSFKKHPGKLYATAYKNGSTQIINSYEGNFY